MLLFATGGDDGGGNCGDKLKENDLFASCSLDVGVIGMNL